MPAIFYSRFGLILSVLTLACLLLAGPLAAQPFLDASVERAAAVDSEKKGDWNTALLHYENIFDSTITDDAARTNLRLKMKDLKAKITPNDDPEQAGVWKVQVYIFRTLDFSWKDKDGKAHHAVYKFRDDEIDAIRSAMDGFNEAVWRNSQGNLRISYDIKVIEKPLTKLDGDYSFWPGPSSCMPYFTDFKPGDADSLFVYAKIRGDKDEKNEDIPLSLLAGTLGVLSDTKGATYIGFNTGGGWCEDASGEVQWHEWLHAAQWALEAYQGYPAGLMASSDSGRTEGESGGDPCFRKKPEEKNWMPFYVHIMNEHATRKMWRELSVTNTPNNPWLSQYCRSLEVCGPFYVKDKPDQGLEQAFINETDAANGGKWIPVSVNGRNINFADFFGPKDYTLAYALIKVQSDKDQLAQVRLGTDDGCKLWLNGKVILYSPVLRSATADSNIVDVQLKKGENTFLLKVANWEGDWEAVFRVTDAEGNPPAGVSYIAPKGG